MMDLETWRAKGEVMAFRGHEVRVYADGPGDDAPWLLLIHGFPTAAWDWHAVWDRLAGAFRLVAPDLLGFGFSDKPRNLDYNFPLQADLCEAALARAGARHYQILAHDYGDTVAQELLARRQQGKGDSLLESVCLLNGGIFPGAHRPRPIQRILAGPLGPIVTMFLNRRRVLDSLARVFGPDSRPSGQEMEAFWSLISYQEGHRIAWRILAYMKERRDNERRWVGALTGSPVPLLFIDGLQDPISGRRATARWREDIGEESLVELEGIGHYPQLEAPERVLEACLPFFERYAVFGERG